ncbi:MAG TPA: helix-turn-helix domain-containing protein [Burkholderiales bacterium]|nr:helix-turn-helix domain-containing protein [Burkholderiales bacterium]
MYGNHQQDIRRNKVKGEGISSIARDLNLSRNTVKKYLNPEIDGKYIIENANRPPNWAYSPAAMA